MEVEVERLKGKRQSIAANHFFLACIHPLGTFFLRPSLPGRKHEIGFLVPSATEREKKTRGKGGHQVEKRGDCFDFFL